MIKWWRERWSSWEWSFMLTSFRFFRWFLFLLWIIIFVNWTKETQGAQSYLIKKRSTLLFSSFIYLVTTSCLLTHNHQHYHYHRHHDHLHNDHLMPFTFNVDIFDLHCLKSIIGITFYLVKCISMFVFFPVIPVSFFLFSVRSILTSLNMFIETFINCFIVV